VRIGLLLAFLSAAAGLPAAAADADSRDTLRVLTYNVWHGLRSGESNKRFPGEEPEDKESRFAAQIDEIHKVTSCGLHLGAIYKIPRNMNEGIAILARPELGLRRVGKKRLSGNAKCTATFGFQTKESRYALFGEITVGGRSILVVTTHFSSPPFVPSDFEQRLDELVEQGTLEAGQREEILAELERKRQRSLAEAQRLLGQIEKRRRDRKNPDRPRAVILGGDFNAEPGTPAIVAIEEAGLRSVAEMVLDREVDGRYLSDHFALLGVLRVED